MRKLFVVVLALVSILLLQAPASAQRLYRLDAVKGPGSPAAFVGVSDCPAGDTITIKAKGFVKESSAPVGADGIFQLSATITDKGRRDRFIEVTSASCARFGPLPDLLFGPKVSIFVPAALELPFTGVPIRHRLALGFALLVTGFLLVRLTAHPTRRTSPTRV
jgi:hypothetical protein